MTEKSLDRQKPSAQSSGSVDFHSSPEDWRLAFNIKSKVPETVGVDNLLAKKETVYPAAKIANAAEELYRNHADRYRTDMKHHRYFCNVFAHDAIEAAGIKPPWGDQAVTVGQMHSAFSQSRDWTQIWPDGSSLKSFAEKSGDIVLWDKIAPHYPNQVPEPLQHCGVLNDKSTFIYAGATRLEEGKPPACAEMPLAEFVRYANLGEPTAIYRYCSRADKQHL